MPDPLLAHAAPDLAALTSQVVVGVLLPVLIGGLGAYLLPPFARFCVRQCRGTRRVVGVGSVALVGGLFAAIAIPGPSHTVYFPYLTVLMTAGAVTLGAALPVTHVVPEPVEPVETVFDGVAVAAAGVSISMVCLAAAAAAF